jgi:hypothetical protein
MVPLLITSTDGGASWSASYWASKDIFLNGYPQNVPLELFPIGDRAFITHEYVGMDVSRDNGSTWISISTFASRRCSKVAALQNKLFAWCQQLFVSSDDGASWTSINTLLQPFSNSFMAATTHALLIGGTGPKGTTIKENHIRILRSTDLGNSWSDAGFLSADGSVLESMAASGTWVYAVEQTHSGGYEVHISQDEGLSWSTLALATDPGNTLILPDQRHLWLSSFSFAGGAQVLVDGTRWQWLVKGLEGTCKLSPLPTENTSYSCYASGPLLISGSHVYMYGEDYSAIWSYDASSLP